VTWISFKELRARLNFADVLRHYGVTLKLKGNQHHGFCPLPKHQGSKKSASFSVSLDKGVFQCFGCQSKGNVLEFAALMEGVDPEDRMAFRQVALKLNEAFPAVSAPSKPVSALKRPAAPAKEPRAANVPLDFTLKGLDDKHPYLTARGVTPLTVAHFGLGFCNRGYLKGRIAIPLHNESGQLVGYAGRIVDDSEIRAESPKYKFPTKREHEGQAFDFRKLDLLYNAHRVAGPVDDLIIVEGFPAVWWLHQHGFPNVVALMGAALGREQVKIVEGLVTPQGRIWLLPDGNDAGRLCAEEALKTFSQLRSVRWVKLEEDQQPTDLTGDELRKLLLLGTQPVAASSVKRRLDRRELSREAAMRELAATFPTVANLVAPTDIWAPESLDAKACVLSSGERRAVQFVLHVWNQHVTWECGRFNVFEALELWDGAHRRAFLAWAAAPWWL
jgi:DNA primase